MAPYTTCLINGIYWDPQTPRLLRRLDAQMLMRPPNVSPASTEGSPVLPHRSGGRMTRLSPDTGSSGEQANGNGKFECETTRKRVKTSQ